MSRAAISSRIRDVHPDHHAIARGLALGASFVFLGKLANAAKEMTVAWRFGVSEVVDAYQFIFNLVTLPIVIWFGVLIVVLVPLAVAIRERTPTELPRFRAELLALTLILGFVLWLLGAFGLPLLLRSSLSGLSPTVFTHAFGIAPILSWIAFLGMPISLFSVWTIATRSHINTLLEGVPALVILIAVLSASGEDATPLVWGTVAGFAFHLLCLSLLSMQKGEFDRPLFTLQSPHWSAFWRGFALLLVVHTLSSLMTVVDQLFAARLGAGAIATLSYANRVLGLLLGLGATAIGRATLPVFSEAESIGAHHSGRIAERWVQVLFAMGILVMLLGWALAPWGVKTLFERGAFTAHDTKAVTEVLRYALLQVPFYFPLYVLVSLISSRKDYTTLTIAGLIGLIAKLLTNVLLTPTMSLNGLVLSTAVFCGASGAFLLAMKGRRNRFEAL